GGVPAAAGLAPAVAHGGHRIRDDVPRDGGSPLLRSRHGGDLRPHLAVRGAAAPMRRALVAAAVAALALPASAFAHASLLHESPSYKQEVQRAPRVVTLSFDQTIEPLPNAVQVLDRRGRNLALPARIAGRTLTAPLRRLPRGPYTVRWRALSTDSHVVSGVYTFGVGVPAPLVTDAVGAEGPTTSEHVVRWIYFLGLALLVGGTAFQLLAGRDAARPRFYVVTGIGAAVVLEAGIA